MLNGVTLLSTRKATWNKGLDHWRSLKEEKETKMFLSIHEELPPRCSHLVFSHRVWINASSGGKKTHARGGLLKDFRGYYRHKVFLRGISWLTCCSALLCITSHFFCLFLHLTIQPLWISLQCSNSPFFTHVAYTHTHTQLQVQQREHHK